MCYTYKCSRQSRVHESTPAFHTATDRSEMQHMYTRFTVRIMHRHNCNLHCAYIHLKTFRIYVPKGVDCMYFIM